MINAAANQLAGKAASCQPAEITEDGAGRPAGSGAPREGRRTAGAVRRPGEHGRAAGVMRLAGFLPRRLLATSRPRLAYFPTLTPGLS